MPKGLCQQLFRRHIRNALTEGSYDREEARAGSGGWSAFRRVEGLESGLDPEVYTNHPFYEGRGCMECSGSGFLGRTAISEVLDLSDRIRELILDRRPASEIKRVAKEEGMVFLRDSALERAFHGVTTLREINKVTFVE